MEEIPDVSQPHTTAEARRRLHAHADPTTDGFLGRLWRAGPDRAAFDDLIDVVAALARPLRLAETLDRHLVRELWSIGFHARSWALNPDGRLVRSGRIGASEQTHLAEWIAAYETAVACWLDGEDDATALALVRGLS
ncbi:MAG: hypothetical protein ACI8PZ_002564 [Myxococcota bacterium]